MKRELLKCKAPRVVYGYMYVSVCVPKIEKS